MKAHIFIATTEGLVAIQNITPIDDDDIRSVVSVNGTSTTANISGSYHNFVKKGVGIIHQMFGACSYRVDISARIDQGNSWQVAMYLAHLAQSKGMLGNGEVSHGDTVICATGEVNTTNLQILPVADVALKCKLAQPQIDQWTSLGAKVQFLLPQAHQPEIKNNNYTVFVSHLEQAAVALPDAPLKQSSRGVKNKKSLTINVPYIIASTLIVLVLILFLGLNKFTLTQSDQHKVLATKANSHKLGLVEKIQLVALLKQYKSCSQTSNVDMELTDKSFADLSLKQLCGLYLQTNKPVVQALLVAQDAYTVLPLSQSQQGWRIPLPKDRSSNRRYFLVTLVQILNEEKIEQLRLFRETMPKPNMLTESTLAEWLENQGVEFTVYTHNLVLQ